jgi:3-dehydroquinate synthase
LSDITPFPKSGGPGLIPVDLGERSYDIHVGDGLLARAGEIVEAVAGARRVIVVSDSTVAGLHLEALDAALDAHALDRAPSILLPPGEGTKSFAALETLLDALFKRGIDRHSVILAFGGGVIGDLAGFAAAVALRGLDFIQIPTTLLAQVDSSVGGKTGINAKAGKNLVGSFHQPLAVIADCGVLRTLPPREMRAGYAEVVKYALIDRPGFFSWLEENGAAVLAGEAGALAEAVAVSCHAKAVIVAEDERESGRRALLNLGHTFAHALEAENGYDSRLLHGEAVSIGMVLAHRLSARLGLCPETDAALVEAHLRRAGLPVDLSAHPHLRDPDRLMAHMARDKKARNGRLVFILSHGIGQAFIAPDIDPADARGVLAEMAGA